MGGPTPSQCQDPLLLAALKGYDEAKRFIGRLLKEFRIAMFLTGSRNVDELSKAPIVFGPTIISWLNQRNVPCKHIRRFV